MNQQPEYSICVGCGKTIPPNTLQCDQCKSPSATPKLDTVSTVTTTSQSGNVLTIATGIYLVVSIIASLTVFFMFAIDTKDTRSTEISINWQYTFVAIGTFFQGWIMFLFASTLNQIQKRIS